ncbi:MAG: GntR family transcriptional regulator [Erysipelotrichaceae bacterium]|nr:GntR family transcriptional regulator [Erysipelotrichaceae bacterium]
MFLINLQGKESIYEQIKSQIEKFIKAGILKADDKLPSVRSLAEELGINPNTVMKAYQELEKNGYIYTLNKKGVFVSRDLNKKSEAIRRDAMNMLNTLKDEGFTKKELMNMLNDIYGEAKDVKNK